MPSPPPPAKSGGRRPPSKEKANFGCALCFHYSALEKILAVQGFIKTHPCVHIFFPPKGFDKSDTIHEVGQCRLSYSRSRFELLKLRAEKIDGIQFV